MTHTARLIRIGNSRGVRLSRAVLEASGLPEELEILVEPGRVTLQAKHPPREGWDSAFATLAAEDAAALQIPGPNRFDAEEWRWE